MISKIAGELVEVVITNAGEATRKRPFAVGKSYYSPKAYFPT